MHGYPPPSYKQTLINVRHCIINNPEQRKKAKFLHLKIEMK